MKTIEEYKKEAYEKAQDECCNTDCYNYQKGTCIANGDKVKNCYKFNHSYGYHLSTARHDDCVKEKEIEHCNMCHERDCCLIAEAYEYDRL